MKSTTLQSSLFVAECTSEPEHTLRIQSKEASPSDQNILFAHQAAANQNAEVPNQALAASAEAWIREQSKHEWQGSSMEYLARHSHSFRYAASFLPPPFDTRISDIYAFCRFTDDLVDKSDTQDARVLIDRLNAWSDLAQEAYAGKKTGLPFIDGALSAMGKEGIPYRYASELIQGVGMDLTCHRYTTVAELEVYTYRVAGVVGLWLTEMTGQRHPQVLRYATDLGHAMHSPIFCAMWAKTCAWEEFTCP